MIRDFKCSCGSDIHYGKGKCKRCYKREYARVWRDMHRERNNEIEKRFRESEKGQAYYAAIRRSDKNKKYQRDYLDTDAGKDSRRRSSRNHREKHPLKIHVREKFSVAVIKGKIKREPCQICGSFAHGHHPDYLKPFTVNWLCPKHHKSLHLNELGFEPITKTYDMEVNDMNNEKIIGGGVHL